jgi:hypothetical protein
MKRTRHQRLWAGLAALAAQGLVVVACASPSDSKTIDPGTLDETGFQTVAPVLQRRCGSLDCHGSRFRNMRLYGYGGLRLAATDTPEQPQSTTAEAAADYDALMGLEPERMQAFIAGGRTDPTVLTLYRKARALEAHKGGLRIEAGDTADVCLLSWLQSTVNGTACSAAASEHNPLDN